MNFLVTGGLGFIGSFFVEKLSETNKDNIVIIDNLSNHSSSALKDFTNKNNITIYKEDLRFCDIETKLKNIDIVFHFAANCDIAAGVSNPDIDFNNGILTTQRLLIAMKKKNIKKLIFASGSGVYGDETSVSFSEDSAIKAVSYYGSSKIAAEALISAFSHMENMNSLVFRFANVIGKRQTHGVIYDLIRKLNKSKGCELDVLGNGMQKKPYILLDDVYEAIIQIINLNLKSNFECFNIGTTELVTVKEIVNLILTELNLVNKTQVQYGTTEGGWKGDVPTYSLNSKKIRNLGWSNKFSSEEAIKIAINLIKESEYDG